MFLLSERHSEAFCRIDFWFFKEHLALHKKPLRYLGKVICVGTCTSAQWMKSSKHDLITMYRDEGFGVNPFFLFFIFRANENPRPMVSSNQTSILQKPSILHFHCSGTKSIQSAI